MSKNIAFFASGSGSNVENIVNSLSNVKGINFPVILSNKTDAYVHKRAEQLNIPSFTFSNSDFAKGDEILSFLQKHNIDGIVLAGFLLKVPSVLINAFPGRIINIHPALLPKYGGKGMYGMNVHKAVSEAGETESGITIHYVNDNYDEGNIIFQAACSIAPGENPETIAQKVHELEYRHFPQVILDVLV